MSESKTRQDVFWTDEELTLVSIILKSYILNLIDKYNVYCWNKDRVAYAEDVLATAMLRAMIYARKVELDSIRSFEAICKWHIKHIVIDLWRKDRRVTHSLEDLQLCEKALENATMSDDPCEIVITRLDQYNRIVSIALIANQLSPKQKEAFLIDTANSADFDEEDPSPLELAFKEVGISLREYCCQLPSNTKLRQRHTASLHLAHKAIRMELVCKNN